MTEKRFEFKWRDTGEVLYDNETGLEHRIYSPDYRFHVRDMMNEFNKENKELKKQLEREETDKKRLMSYLMRYKGFSFDEIVEDFLEEPYYDNWWGDGFYEFCWKEYIEEKELSE